MAWVPGHSAPHVVLVSLAPAITNTPLSLKEYQACLSEPPPSVPEARPRARYPSSERERTSKFMSNVTPAEIVEQAVTAGTAKATASSGQMVHRAVLGGALLGCTTTFAVFATLATGSSLAGALVFPAGITIVILMGMELLTGGCALVPMAAMQRKTKWANMARYFLFVSLGHLMGGVLFAALFAAQDTGFWTHAPSELGMKLIGVAEGKTLTYEAMGGAGLATVFVRAVLCNWLVSLGVLMGMTSKDTIGKIAAIWLPVMVFFGLGFEHAVVNFAMIPLGVFLGADISLAEWWGWNQIPVLLGNFLGGFILTGMALLFAYRPAVRAKAATDTSTAA